MKTKTKPRKLLLNSEGDAYEEGGVHIRDWSPTTKAERELLALWERGMDVFRNWKAQREGKKFSQVDTCWLPNARLDKKAVLALSTEFSSAGCWLAKDRKADKRPCLPTKKVKAALDALLAANKPPAGVSAEVKETDTNYFEIVVEADAKTFEDAVAYVKALSLGVLADETLDYARENIC